MENHTKWQLSALIFSFKMGKQFKRLAYYSFNWFQIEIPSLSHGGTITNIGIKTSSWNPIQRGAQKVISWYICKEENPMQSGGEKKKFPPYPIFLLIKPQDSSIREKKKKSPCRPCFFPPKSKDQLINLVWPNMELFHS
mgnify:CR=1 FL=1